MSDYNFDKLGFRPSETRRSDKPPELGRVKLGEPIQAGRETDGELLEWIKSLKPGYNPEKKSPDVDQRLVKGIIQKEYAITNADSDVPIIGTFGLGPCIALVVYDPITNTAALAHVDSMTNIDSLGTIFDDMEVTDKQLARLRVGLIGGDSSSRGLVIAMVRYLQSKGVQLSYANILEKFHPSTFVIDSRNGEIIPNVTLFNNDESGDLRMKLTGSQTNARIKKEFDGRPRLA